MGKIRHVLQLSWEYPPRIIGKIAPHVKKLSELLAEQNVAVDVVTFDDWRVGIEREDKITLHRCGNPITPCTNILTWVLTMHVEMERMASDMIHDKGKKPDIIHAHDWIALPAAISLHHEFEIPLVLSIHSLEKHRAKGSYNTYVAAIEKIEWQGCFEASQIIVETEWMRDDIIKHYNVPEYKMHVVSPEADDYIDKIIEIYGRAVF